MSNYSDAIDAGNYFNGSVCVNCLTYLANDEKPQDVTEWNYARVVLNLNEYDVVLGHIAEDSHPGEPCDDDSECTQTDFSRRPCSLCGTQLAGSRDDVIMVAYSDFRE